MQRENEFAAIWTDRCSSNEAGEASDANNVLHLMLVMGNDDDDDDDNGGDEA